MTNYLKKLKKYRQWRVVKLEHRTEYRYYFPLSWLVQLNNLIGLFVSFMLGRFIVIDPMESSWLQRYILRYPFWRFMLVKQVWHDWEAFCDYTDDMQYNIKLKKYYDRVDKFSELLLYAPESSNT